MALVGTNILISEQRDYNPDTGATIIRTYLGTEAQIEIVRAYWELAGAGAPVGYGYKTTIHRDANGVRLTVRIPDDILYTDRWGLETEARSIPIWWNEQIRQYLGFQILTGDVLTQLNQDKLYFKVRGLILTAVDLFSHGQGDTIGTVINQLLSAGYDFATYEKKFFDIVYLIQREGESMEWKRPVLRRNRTIPVGAAGRTTLVGTQNVYTTADALDDAFSLPDDIYDQIVDVQDGLPDAPLNSTWGWKMRRDDSDIMIGFGKYVECRDWVYDRWSTITHNLIE